MLPPRTLTEIRGLENWIRRGDVLMNQWNMRHKLRPGCRALFFGPPGTGKTLTATVLGKVTERQVYKVDLSMVVSKYIGETEKNLSGLFDRAEHKEWVLFLIYLMPVRETHETDHGTIVMPNPQSHPSQRIATCCSPRHSASTRTGRRRCAG